MNAALLASTVVLGSVLGAPAPGEPGSAAASGGMGSPAAAVEELLASVRASDPLGLLAVLHPDERYLVDTLYSNSTGTAEAAGTVDVDTLLRALHVDVITQPLAVEQLSDRVAWVTTSSAQVVATLDATQVDAAVAADLADWEQPDPYVGEFEPQADHLGVAVVNEGGSWFVSALYTVAEVVRRDLELPLSVAASPAATGAATPEAAVMALTAAVSAKDWASAAATLTPFERALVDDYSTSIGGELLDAIENYTLRVEPTHVQVIDQGDSWAIVEVDAWTFGLSGTDPDEPDLRTDAMLTVEGICGELRDWDNWDEEFETSKSCAFEDDSVFNVFQRLADAGWRGPRFAVVQQNGVWSVSLLQTVLQSTAPFTVDIDTFAGIVEFAAQVVVDDADDFYPAAISLLAAPIQPLGPGTTTVSPRASGEYALFRVAAGATVAVAVPPGDHAECFVVVIDEEDGDIVGGSPCGEPIEPIAAPATLLVTTSQMAFASISALGDIEVTVS